MDKDNFMLPNKESLIRTAISGIPTVGAVFEHLLYDQADEIRLKNIETSIDEINKRLSEVDDHFIDRTWFSTTECLALFRIITDELGYEPDIKRIGVFSQVFVNSSKKKNTQDNRKLSIVSHMLTLSFVQLKLLKILSDMNPEKKQILSNGFQGHIIGLWMENIEEAINSSTLEEKFWEGDMELSLEIEILCATNTINRIESIADNIPVYQLTQLGKVAVNYLENI